MTLLWIALASLTFTVVMQSIIIYWMRRVLSANNDLTVQLSRHVRCLSDLVRMAHARISIHRGDLGEAQWFLDPKGEEPRDLQ